MAHKVLWLHTLESLDDVYLCEGAHCHPFCQQNPGDVTNGLQQQEDVWSWLTMEYYTTVNVYEREP